MICVLKLFAHNFALQNYKEFLNCANKRTIFFGQGIKKTSPVRVTIYERELLKSYSTSCAKRTLP